MNEEDYPEKPSGFLLGKEFIIVLVIVFSGISFVLGYFVGKNTADTSPAVPPLTEGTTQQTRQDATPPLPVRPLQQENTATADTVPAPSVQQAVAPAAPEKTDTAAAGASQVRRKSADIDSTGTDRNATGNTAENQTGEKPRVYTVQIGAFKSSAEAKQLKVKFEKKGYKPFISAVKDRNGNKIYKIKTGEFADRKDAEVLALKLKKTEGLHTYVTTTSE